ncbi:hypothetical protein DN752_01395 [Echinicola strongylocentroti]|uniref:Uncharacterized protein n=1 Tax=Echinicola strongylocentroti TaxID=1795355 RepID=A0A2Z4ID01_9BACT|nr:hypothetical protein DN752_01395 [Echinicola strongylocentroti]
MSNQLKVGFFIIFIFVIWQFKMYYHFNYLKKTNKVKSRNYVYFLFDPFLSGFYRMMILLPIIFDNAGDKNLKKGRYCCYLLYGLIITVFILQSNMND